MNPQNHEDKISSKPSRQISWRGVIYFGLPILVALLSALFPIRPFLRQAMVGFILLWFVIGTWLLNTPQ